MDAEIERVKNCLTYLLRCLVSTSILGVAFVAMDAAIGNRSDVPALFAMAAFFSFGLFAILRTAALRNAMDKFANTWRQGSWHPYKIPCSCGWRLDSRCREVQRCSCISRLPCSGENCCNIALKIPQRALLPKLPY